jgi:uncharacterized CHY-type Zn-finger protein
MTDEYISREAALEITTRTCGDYAAAFAEIRKLPAADVAEVHHARWEEADWHEYDAQSGETIRFPKAAIVCSDCRNAFKKDALWKRNSCPNCGAKMDGAAE